MLKTAAGVFILCVCDSIMASVPSGSSACVCQTDDLTAADTEPDVGRATCRAAVQVSRSDAALTSVTAKERNAAELVVLVWRNGDDDFPLKGFSHLKTFLLLFFLFFSYTVSGKRGKNIETRVHGNVLELGLDVVSVPQYNSFISVTFFVLNF